MKSAPPPGDLERSAAIATWRNSIPQGRGNRPPVDSTLHEGTGWSGPATTTVGFPNAKFTFSDANPGFEASDPIDTIHNDRAA